MEEFHHISNKTDFLVQLENYRISKDDLFKAKFKATEFRTDPTTNTSGILLSNLELDGQELSHINFMGLNFVNCIFHNIRFKDFNSTVCSFKNCVFDTSHFTTVGIFESSFEDCTFKSCNIEMATLADTNFINTTFIDCHDLLELYFGGCYVEKTTFTRCSISHSRFSPIFENASLSHFNFINCFLNVSHFLNLNLSKSHFDNCVLEQLIFSNCFFSKETFTKCSVKDENYCSIDLQTIKQSEKIDLEITKSLFGLYNADVKEYVSELTMPISFQSVFISYSFKDKVFANKINDNLKARGIFTFLWENDAPIGQPNKKIMAENIKKHDRLLFIASENSIKSEACQFELTQGRKKQEELWKTIFFPIHIDNYLFEVEEDDIKPKSKKDEYWTNILEIREISSLDFISNAEIDEPTFALKIDKLVKNLRK